VGRQDRVVGEGRKIDLGAVHELWCFGIVQYRKLNICEALCLSIHPSQSTPVGDEGSSNKIACIEGVSVANPMFDEKQCLTVWVQKRTSE
jgi:hypothetical protein